MGLIGRRTIPVVVLALVLVGAAGCSTLNKQANTYIRVDYGGENMLHLAVIPRVLPQGQPADQVRDALLEDVASAAGGYTYIERVIGAWKPKPTKATRKQVDDLLIVAGKPELALMLNRRLREDFKQSSPFVLSLPIQAVRLVRVAPAPMGEPAAASAAQPAP